MTEQHQVRVRLSLPTDLHTRLVALQPAVRSQAVSTVLASVLDGVDLPRVAACTEQMRRLGNLLNQALHYSYRTGNFDAQRVKDIILFFDRLRAPIRRR